jgi:hypothetical protein
LRVSNLWENIPMRYQLLILSAASAFAHADVSKTFEGTCGAARFRVTAINSGTPLENVFTLAAVTSSGTKNLYIGNGGGWFHAACLPKKDGKVVLVFQSYCGGSICREGKYGVVEPSSLKLLLRPSSKNIENDKQLSALLGTPAPRLSEYKGAFCCEP